MKTSIFLFGLLIAMASAQTEAPLNTLTPAEEEAGFTLMFDGEGWDDELIALHNNWIIDEEEKAINATSSGQDACFADIYKDFEFRFDLRIDNDNQNSGVFTRAPNLRHGSWGDGAPEFTIQGGTGPRGPDNYPQAAGDDYAMKRATSYPQITGGGVYNPNVLFFNGAFVEFWMNGEKVNEYEMWSEEWDANQERSARWSGMSSYGSEDEGYVCIQGHGGDQAAHMWFRNLRIRSFEADGQAPAPHMVIDSISENSAEVTLDAAMIGAEIRYTIDGSDPDENSTLYEAGTPVEVMGGTEIKAIAIKERFTASDVTADTFTGGVTSLQNKISLRGSMTLRQSSNSVILKFSRTGNYRVTVHNVSGKTVLSHSLKNQNEFDFSTINMAPGVYTVHADRGIQAFKKSMVIF